MNRPAVDAIRRRLAEQARHDYEQHVEREARNRDAARAWGRAKDVALERVLAEHGLAHGSDGDYGPRSPHSWFADSIRARLARDTADRLHDRAAARSREHVEPMSVFMERTAGGSQGPLEDALQRLAGVPPRAPERRDLTTSSTPGGGGFVPAGQVPAFVARHFVEAAHARSVVAGLLPGEDLPAGLAPTVPFFEGAATVSMQASENAALAESSPDTGVRTGVVGVAAGLVDVSAQLLERSSGGAFDVYLARELGAALAERVDLQLLNGAGSGGETVGVLGTSGITTGTYTDATPTWAEMLKPLFQLAATASAAYGGDLPLLLAHSRRAAWLYKETGTGVVNLPAELVVTNGIPTTLGTGTNEDRLILLDPAACIHFSRPPELRVFPEVGSGALTVRVRAMQTFALLVREPLGVAVLSGTGLSTPSWT